MTTEVLKYIPVIVKRSRLKGRTLRYTILLKGKLHGKH